MEVRPIDQAQKKFADRAAGARGDYETGVRGAGAKWIAGVQAAESAWADGTRAAIDAGRFGAGVRRAGPTKYQDRASKLGPDRYATGVRDVIVNGVHVLKDGEHTDARPGRALLGPGAKLAG